MKIARAPFGCMYFLTAIRYPMPAPSVSFACLQRRLVAGTSISILPLKAVDRKLSPSTASCRVSEENGAALNH